MEFRNFSEIKRVKLSDEKVSTVTSREQIATEHLVERCFDRFEQLKYLDPSLPHIYRDEHIRYLENSLRSLSSSYECLDCSRPWLIYWTLNSAHLLNFKFADDLLDQTVEFLVKCRQRLGGFGGGPQQYAHLASTYAAVNSLCIIGTEKAYEAIDRNSLKQFFRSVREDNGAFRLHVGGEIDVRGAYCAVSCAKLVSFSQEEEAEIFSGTADWICSCQTFEGGFGGAPDLEAHGGYSFCGIASLALLGQGVKCDLKSLMRWTAFRQMRYEGGFQGRTNKLVDGCYSFWVGGIFPIVQAILALQEPNVRLLRTALFDQGALQEYVLLCCQRPSGGLLDKPSKGPDLYHTCYTLSGISVSQHQHSLEPLVLGNPTNELLPIHPVHNIPPSAAVKSYVFFSHPNMFNSAAFRSDTSEIISEDRIIDDESDEDDYDDNSTSLGPSNI